MLSPESCLRCLHVNIANRIRGRTTVGQGPALAASDGTLFRDEDERARQLALEPSRIAAPAIGTRHYRRACNSARFRVALPFALVRPGSSLRAGLLPLHPSRRPILTGITPPPAERRPLFETHGGTHAHAFGATEWLLLAAIALIWGASFFFIDVALDAFAP